MLGIFVFENVLHKIVICIQSQSLVCGEHAHVHGAHAVHGVHLHHILHTSSFLGEGDNGRDVLIFQLLDFDCQLVVVQCFLEDFGQSVCLILQVFRRSLIL